MSGLSQWCENVEAKVAFLAEASRTGILPFDAKAPNALAARGFFWRACTLERDERDRRTAGVARR
jgi:hypothetical protein